MSDKEKQLINKIFRINFMVFIIFNTTFMLANGDYLFSFFFMTPLSIAALAVALSVMIFALVTIYRNYNSIKQLNVKFKQDSKTKLKTYAELTISALGFSLMAASAILMVPLTADPNPPIGINQTRFWHPNLPLSGFIFFAGCGLVLLALLLYHEFIPNQIVKETAMPLQVTPSGCSSKLL